MNRRLYLSYRGYVAAQLWLCVVYLYGGLLGIPSWLALTASYSLLFWQFDKVSLWMRNRDERGRFVKGHGPISG